MKPFINEDNMPQEYIKIPNFTGIEFWHDLETNTCKLATIDPAGYFIEQSDSMAPQELVKFLMPILELCVSKADPKQKAGICTTLRMFIDTHCLGDER